MNKLQEKMFSLGVARFFAAKLEAQAQADLRELQRSVLSYSRRKKNIRDIGFRKVVATLAEEVYDPHDGKKWRSRDLPELAPEELQKAFSPEDVCLQESAAAAEVRLADFGMEDVDLGALEVCVVAEPYLYPLTLAALSRPGRAVDTPLDTPPPTPHHLHRHRRHDLLICIIIVLCCPRRCGSSARKH
jgi:hypothetical protein